MPILKSINIKAYVLLSITALLWGGNAVAGKLAVGHISPLLLTLLRWSVALVAITLVSLPEIRRDMPMIRRHLPYLLAMGAVGFTGFNALLYSALQYTSTINAVIEQAGIPMLIFFGNFILFRMVASGGQVAGFLLTLVGVAITASGGDVNRLLSLTFNYGDVLMLGALVVYASYTIALRFKPALHWKSMMAATAAGAALAAIPLAAFEFYSSAAIFPDTRGILIILYTGLFPSLVSQIFYVMGVQMIGGNRAGLFVNMVPIFGTFLSVLVVGEALHIYHMAALFFVICGIILSERSRPAEKLA